MGCYGMKMIRAVIRPEAVDKVADNLEAGGFTALTRIEVFGRGKQKGIKVGNVVYDNLPKTMLMLVVGDDQTEKAVQIIEESPPEPETSATARSSSPRSRRPTPSEPASEGSRNERSPGHHPDEQDGEHQRRSGRHRHSLHHRLQGQRPGKTARPANPASFPARASRIKRA